MYLRRFVYDSDRRHSRHLCQVWGCIRFIVSICTTSVCACLCARSCCTAQRYLSDRARLVAARNLSKAMWISGVKSLGNMIPSTVLMQWDRICGGHRGLAAARVHLWKVNLGTLCPGWSLPWSWKGPPSAWRRAARWARGDPSQGRRCSSRPGRCRSSPLLRVPWLGRSRRTDLTSGKSRSWFGGTPPAT